MAVERESCCKVNLILNILGRRGDGFHELETVFQPVPVFDRLRLERKASAGIEFRCDDPRLPIDGSNLVHRAAAAFLRRTKIQDGVRIQLEKRIPIAAGLGGGSGNAAATLAGLNQLFDTPLDPLALQELAAGLGSDVPFFLRSGPALAGGRGETIETRSAFAALCGAWIVLIYPGFGIATAWAYQQLARFPQALHGIPGRARRLADALASGTFASVPTLRAEFYNSLEAPVLPKYPVLELFQEHLRNAGAAVALMSGSGSTTFALVADGPTAERVVEGFRSKFGSACWVATGPLGSMTA